jgi:hypothetical protein
VDQVCHVAPNSNSPDEQEAEAMKVHCPYGYERGMKVHCPYGYERGMKVHCPYGYERGMKLHSPYGYERGTKSNSPYEHERGINMPDAMHFHSTLPASLPPSPP